MECNTEIKTKLTQNFDVEKAEVQIFKTKNYRLFTLDTLNREPKHYKKIVDSINLNDFTPYNPILVNPSDDGGFTIIDGQNRFLACKELNKEIYFVVAGEATIDDAPQLNNASKNWDTLDYIKYYIGKGKRDYITLLDVVNKYNVPLTAIMNVGITSNRPIEKIKNGEYKFNPKNNIYDFCEHLSEFDGYIPFHKSTIFIRTLGTIFFHKDYDPSHMINKLTLYSGMLKQQPTMALTRIEIIKVYNYRSTSKNKVNFN